MHNRIAFALLTMSVLMLAGPAATAEESPTRSTGTGAQLAGGDTPGAGPIRFDDVRRDSVKFIRYNKTITLTPKQNAIMREALTAMRAPCCNDKSAYTCCCPCNMAQTGWGLSKYLITEHNYDAVQVRATVAEWYSTINPRGFTGDACYTGGGCGRAFASNGCGGMDASHIIW